MIPLTLPGIPRLSPSGEIWKDAQRQELVSMWQDIKRILDSMRRSTGLTAAIPTGTVIPHNLGLVPSIILITAQDTGPTDIHPSAITLTSFTLNFGGGGSHVFGWSAEI